MTMTQKANTKNNNDKKQTNIQTATHKKPPNKENRKANNTANMTMTHEKP